MKKIILFSVALLAMAVATNAQVSCTNATHRTLTSYTNGMTNDSLFFICAGQTATLIATPPSGTPGWDFVWQQFNVAGNSWNPLVTVPGVPVSQQSNLAPGGYRVMITDGTNTIVGVYIVWVCRINSNPSVNVNAIAPGCGNVQLSGQINGGSITPYYNPPSLVTDPNSSLIVTAETEITVCFTGIHTYVSDLGFYLVGPASCGSPTILLSPNPGSNGQGTVCNSADNFTNLCFSTESTNILHQCTFGTYTGTYGGYGVGAGTMINWAGLYGCDASQAGWAVQVYDCIGGDVGFLTGASITVTGASVGGPEVTYPYSTPSGFSSYIADNSCSPSTASIFIVPAAPAVAINFPAATYEWTANPPFNIPNSTTSLNTVLSPGPTVDTEFTLSLVGSPLGTICGGNSSDTKLFDYTPPSQAVINPVASFFCIADEPFNLSANISGGTWSGTGITNAANGTFSPAVAGEGSHTVTYTPTGSCTQSASVVISITGQTQANIQPVNPLCSNANPVTLTVNIPGGTWSGDGITNSTNGTFDPSVAGPGTHTVSYYQEEGVCPANGTTSIIVEGFIQPAITAPASLCIDADTLTLTATPAGGTWSGTGVSNTGGFDPAAAGTGNATVTYSISGVCPATANTTIAVNALPVVNAGADVSICPGTSTALTATGAQTYSWTPATGLSSSSVAWPNASPANTTTYTVTGTANGCSATDQVTVTVYPAANVTVNGPFTICAGGSVQLSMTGLTNFSWNNTASLSSSTTATPTASPASTTTYTVSGTNANGCAGSADITVTIVNAQFSYTPEEGLPPLTVEFTNLSNGNEFHWDFGNGDTDTTNDPATGTSTIYENDGVYTVTLTVINNNVTCDVSHTVTAYGNSEIILIPNVVTLDGNKDNEEFRILSLRVKTMSVQVFDRWGKKVGEFDSPTGSWNPRDYGDGTYFYTLKAEGLDKKKYEQGGYFTVVR